jgi:carbon monoxide dehydrogenase subunit G
MLNIESKTVEIKKSDKTIFEFLSNFDNFNKLMPPQVENFKSEGNSCSFTISGMPELKLHISEKIKFSKVEFSSDHSFQFEIKLITNIINIDENNCKVKILFNSNISGMFSFMLQKPLENFINMLAEKLKDINI